MELTQIQIEGVAVAEGMRRCIPMARTNVITGSMIDTVTRRNCRAIAA